MAIKNKRIGGTDYSDPARIKPDDLNDTFDRFANALIESTVTFLKGISFNTELAQNNSITDKSYDLAQSDYFSSNSGYNGTVDTNTFDVEVKDSHNSNDGTHFGGKDHYIDTNTKFSILNAFTFSAWVNLDTLKSNQWIMIQGDNTTDGPSLYDDGTEWVFRLRDNGVVNASVRTNASYSHSQWVHLVGTYDGSQIEFFVDGSSQGTSSGGMTLNNNNMIIGSLNGNSDFVEGRIEDIGIWSRALSSSEVSTIYNNGKRYDYSNFSSSLKSSLEAYYKTNENPIFVDTSTPNNYLRPLYLSIPYDDFRDNSLDTNLWTDNSSGGTFTEKNQEGDFSASASDSNNTEVINSAVLTSDDNFTELRFDSGKYTLDSPEKGTDTHGSNTPLFYGTFPRQVTGIISNAQDFDGTNDYIETGITDASDSKFTWNAWFKTTSTNNIYLMGDQDNNDDGYYLSLNASSTGELRFADNSNLITSTSSNLNDGNWHMVSVVDDGAGNQELFIDGSSNGTSSNSMTAGNTEFTIGARSVPRTSLKWKGQIDEVGIWSRDLSSSEISTLYNSGSGKAYSTFSSSLKNSLKSYYELEESANAKNYAYISVKIGSTIVFDSISKTPNSTKTAKYDDKFGNNDEINISKVDENTFAIYSGTNNPERYISSDSGKVEFRVEAKAHQNGASATQDTSASWTIDKVFGNSEKTATFELYSNTFPHVNNAESIIVTADNQQSKEAGVVTFDVSSDGGNNYEKTDQPLNKLVSLDGDDNDIKLRFNLKSKLGKAPQLKGYAFQIWGN